MQSNTWAEGYESLGSVLQRAHDQAAHGKGAKRHADSKPFDSQPMQTLIGLYGVGFAYGQAGKKMEEAQRMDTAAAVNELLGAINYIAGAVIALERGGVAEAASSPDGVASVVAPQPDADGWIEWRGGSCPVLPQARVVVRLQDGTELSDWPAGDCRWSHLGSAHDIVAYRVAPYRAAAAVAPKAEEAKPDADGWIEWSGGPPGKHIEFKTEGGFISKARVAYLGWNQLCAPSGIVAYRLLP